MMKEPTQRENRNSKSGREFWLSYEVRERREERIVGESEAVVLSSLQKRPVERHRRNDTRASLYFRSEGERLEMVWYEIN